jgi:hypothetical protein
VSTKPCKLSNPACARVKRLEIEFLTDKIGGKVAKTCTGRKLAENRFQFFFQITFAPTDPMTRLASGEEFI